ncbi:MAG: proton-conducting transporter membrane subunit, partial [Candidatus Limnocylindria bacterium]|nr:proton-conducting transporter membrane subunit [Candidatus Limnocylindria bacterium]
FMGAGAVDAATGTRDLEHLGGLVKRMPATAALFLIGSAAISGLPPLNGFASEWLTFQALLVTGRGAPELGLALPPRVGGALLALTGALALACFVKAFGVGFLGLARSGRAAEAHETGRAELAGMGLLAAACVALGLGAAPVVSALGPVTAALAGSAMPARDGTVLHAQPAAMASGSLALPWLAVAVVALALAVPALVRLAAGPARTRVVETWACGGVLQPLNEYTSTAFAKPIRLMFRDLVRPVRDVDVIHRLGTRFVARIEYRSSVAPVFERYLYRAFTDRLVEAARLLRRIQNGSLQAYLAYLCAALVALLVLAR